MPVIPNLARHDPGRVRLAGRALGFAAAALALAALLQGAAVWRLRAGSGAPARGAAAPAEPGAAGAAVAGDLAPEETRALAAKVAFLNGILEAGAVSWTGLLAELEEALPAEAHLAEVRPDAGTGRMRLTGVAPSPDAVAEFVRRLEARAAFREVFLLQQAEAAAAPGVRPAVAFSVSLAYRSVR